jgi:branched-chain amino acid transport system substrate-binding protein
MLRVPPALAACLLAALLPGGAAARAGDSVSQRQAPGNPPVTIGLFLPDRTPEAPAGREALRGAELAVAAANRGGGIRGRPVQLAGASSDVPWSAATDALVRLIYDEHAVAIVGALDGRTGHLAEQIITRAKGQTVFVTPWASETTLTRIRIPWFFQMVPDDRRQGEALAREIFQVRRLRRAAALTEKGLDPESACAALESRAPAGAVVRFDAADPAARRDLEKRSAQGEFGAVILFTGAGAAGEAVRSLSRLPAGAPAVFGPLSLARPGFLGGEEAGPAEGTILLAPAGLWSAPAAAEFRRDFKERYSAVPTPLAAFSHDAVKVLVEALRKLPSPESDGLAETLAGIRTGGVTGEIRFDNHLGRDAAPIFVRVRGSELIPQGGAVPAGGR